MGGLTFLPFVRDSKLAPTTETVSKPEKKEGGGKDGKEGKTIKGDKGDDGKDGKNGKDGTLDSVDDIASKLGALKKEWLPIDSIIGDFNTRVDRRIVTAGSGSSIKSLLDVDYSGLTQNTQGQYMLGSGSGGGSSSIGGAVTGGLDNSVLFINPAGILDQDNTNFTYDKAFNQFQIGPSNSFTGINQIGLNITKNINNYVGQYIQNKNGGDTASTDVILGNDIDTTAIQGHYIDMGIGSSGYIETAAATGIIKTVVVGAGGTGYAVGNILTISTGDGLAQVQVLTITGSAVATVSITNNGSGYTTGIKATTGGAGTGATINITALFDYTLFTANDGYVYTEGGHQLIGTSALGYHLKFFTGGTATANERMRITDTGNVGIGTISPFSGASVINSLELGNFNGANADGNLIVRGYAALGGTSKSGYGAVGSNYYLSSANSLLRKTADSVSVLDFPSAGFVFRTAGGGTANSSITLTTLMTLNASGNLGLGATSPASKFHISQAPIATINYGTLSLGGGLFDGVSGNRFISSNSGGTSIAVNELAGYTGDLLSLQVGGVSKFSLRASDGTITSTGEFRSGSMTLTNTGFRFGSLTGTIQMGANGVVGSASAEIDLANISAASNPGTIVFRTGTASIAQQVEVARFDALGNFGIGTTAPTSNLQVNQSTTGVGTISVGAAGTTVTGVGTQFLNTFKVGDTITSAAQTLTISAIASDTSMTTSAAGAAITAQAYTLVGGTRLQVFGNGIVHLPLASKFRVGTSKLLFQNLYPIPAGIAYTSATDRSGLVVTDNDSQSVYDGVIQGTTSAAAKPYVFTALRAVAPSSINLNNGSGSSYAAFGEGMMYWAQPNLVSAVTDTSSRYGYVAHNYFQANAGGAAVAFNGTYQNFRSTLQLATTITNVGTITDYYAGAITGTGNGTVTNRYGLLIDFDNNSVTNAYGIYQSSSTIKNYFAGNIGIGQTSPTAVLHLKAGTATASTAPLKFTSGIALTTPEDGAIEYHSSHIYATIGSTRYQLDQQSAGGGITWTEVTGTTQAAAVDNGYITNNAGLVTVTLPDTAAVGKIVRISGSGAGGWRLAQNALENIRFGNVVTTTGIGGYLQSTNQYDAVEVVCIVANTTWSVISSQGSITYV